MDSPGVWGGALVALIGLLFAGLYRLSSGIEPNDRQTEYDEHMKGDSD